MAAIVLKNVDIVFGEQPKQALSLLDQGASRDEILAKTGQVLGAAEASISLEEGEVCVLMGLSGSGKSTLLRAINGLNTVTRGQVLVEYNDQQIDVANCNAQALRELRMHKVAMVFQQLARLVKAATEVRAEPFQMSLDITGQFERAQVAWLGCSHPPQQLLNFQLTLEATLRNNCPDHPAFSSGVRVYRPHLTLYRHVKTALPLHRFSPIHWPVSSFSLIESHRGQQPVYQTLNSWDLQSVS